MITCEDDYERREGGNYRDSGLVRELRGLKEIDDFLLGGYRCSSILSLLHYHFLHSEYASEETIETMPEKYSMLLLIA